MSPPVNGPITRTVFSFPFPETERVRRDLQSGDLSHLYEGAWVKFPTGGGDLRARQEQSPDVFVRTWREWVEGARLDLMRRPGPGHRIPEMAFPYGYVHHGAGGAIDKLIAEALIRGNDIHHFVGDYEGFSQAALSMGAAPTRVHAHHRPFTQTLEMGTEEESFKDGDLFFITQPSSLDGHYWPYLHLWLAWMARHFPKVQIIVDVTYVGCVAAPQPIELGDLENVEAVIHSMSKPFGMYYDRIGVCVSRHEHPSMMAVHRWMHNEFSILLGTAMMTRFSPVTLPRRYQRAAIRVLDRLKETGVVPENTFPAHVWMLAVATDATGWKGDPKEWDRGGAWMRFCLTPGIFKLVKEGILL